MKQCVLIVVAAAMLASGCASHKSEKAALQRGWIGGEYQQTKPGSIPPGQRSAIYVKQVYAGTPAEQAGLQPADLILAVNGQKTARLRDFRRSLDAATPGSRMAIQIQRAGQTLELPVTIGRETFQKWHSVRMGLGLSARVDLWPDRDFSILSLVQYKFPQERMELRSPETILAKPAANAPAAAEAGTRSDEGWDVWLVLFGFDAHKQILSQEVVPAQTALAPSR